MKRSRRNEKGQTMVEYLLVIVLVALASFGIWQALVGSLETTGGNIGTTLESAGSGE